MTEEDEKRAQADYRRIFLELMSLLEPKRRAERYGEAAAKLVGRYGEEDFPAPTRFRLLLAAELLEWMRVQGEVS